MSDGNGNGGPTFTDLVELLSTYAGREDDARLMQGEAAHVIAEKWGDLKRAAIESHISYKTLAERRNIVRFYGESSAGQNIAAGSSFARRLLDDNPTLRYTHLRLAVGLGNRALAYEALMEAAEEAMTPDQFKRHVALERAKNGHKPTRLVIDGRAGYRVEISKP